MGSTFFFVLIQTIFFLSNEKGSQFFEAVLINILSLCIRHARVYEFNIRIQSSYSTKKKSISVS